MEPWYLNTTSEFLRDAYQRSPFDVITFDADGNAKHLSRFHCLGVGLGMEYVSSMLSYWEIPNEISPITLVEPNQCIVLVTREKSANEFLAKWFKVDPKRLHGNFPYERLGQIAASEKTVTPFLPKEGEEKAEIGPVFWRIRGMVLGAAMCFIDGSGHLSMPTLFDVAVEDEADGVALGLFSEDVSSDVFSIGSTLTVTGSTLYVSGSNIWNSTITTGKISLSTINDGFFSVGGEQVRLFVEDKVISMEVGIGTEKRRYYDETDMSLDCVYPGFMY